MQLNKIYNTDCLELMAQMPDNFIDLVITSPPYNKNGIGGELVGKVSYGNHNDCLPENEYQELQIKILNELYRVSKMLFYNHKVRYDGFAIHPMEWIVKSKWKLWQEIIWNRKITGNLRGWRCWNIDERIYWLVKEKVDEISQPMAQWTSVWEITPERNIEHPAPFPEDIAKRCLHIGSKKGMIIYDPFMGSGTVAVVSHTYKRNWIGSEINTEYCAKAEKRLAPYLAQTFLF